MQVIGRISTINIKATMFAAAALTAALAGTTACAKEAFESWPAGASVKIESPQDGEKVDREVKFVLSVKGAKLESKGSKAKAGAGHFYLIMDDDPVPLGHAVSAGSSQRQVIWTTETMVNVPSDLRSHSFTLQFVDGDNRSYGPKASHTIRNIKVGAIN